MAVAAAATIVQLIFRSVVPLDIQFEFLVIVGKMDLGWEQESAAQKEYHKQIYCHGLGFFILTSSSHLCFQPVWNSRRNPNSPQREDGRKEGS